MKIDGTRCRVLLTRGRFSKESVGASADQGRQIASLLIITGDSLGSGRNSPSKPTHAPLDGSFGGGDSSKNSRFVENAFNGGDGDDRRTFRGLVPTYERRKGWVGGPCGRKGQKNVGWPGSAERFHEARACQAGWLAGLLTQPTVLFPSRVGFDLLLTVACRLVVVWEDSTTQAMPELWIVAVTVPASVSKAISR